MNRKVKISLASGILGFILCACSILPGKASSGPDGHGQSTWKRLERSTLDSGDVNYENASAPFRRYLLIKDGGFLCAVKFTDYWRGGDAHPGSIWSSGEETLTSQYEWNVLEAVGNKVKVKSHGSGIVKFTAPWGLGRLIFGGGPGNIKCGSREYGWRYPGAVIFAESPEMALAPTRWDTIDKIRLDDPKLVWYPPDPDEKRKDVDIPLSDL